MKTRSSPVWRGLFRLTLLAAAAAPGFAWAYTCTVGATSTAFGVYAPSAASPTDSTGAITVTCSPNIVSLPITYTVALSSGGAGSYASRRMASGANTLLYQLYSNATHATVWGDGTAATSVVGGGFTLGLIFPVSATHTVYGRMPALQSGAVAGGYSDTITVTLTF